MKRPRANVPPPADPVAHAADVDMGYQYLLLARACFAHSPYTLARVREAISSAKGARRIANGHANPIEHERAMQAISIDYKALAGIGNEQQGTMNRTEHAIKAEAAA